MNKMEPLVSIFMPTYNQEDFIGEAIESVLDQDYTNLEIVIGDDFSQDRTWEIVQQFQRENTTKIKAFRNERNLGITGNCNEVLKHCTGKYIAFHAGDDVFLAEKIRKQVETMENNKNSVICYHDIEVFESKTGDILRYWNSGGNAISPEIGDAKKMSALLVERFASFWGAQSVMIRKEKLGKDAKYDERLPRLSELSFWLNLLANSEGEVIYISEVLGRYRKHETNITKQDNKGEYFIFLSIVDNEYPGLLSAARKARGYLYYELGVRNIFKGNASIGRSYLLNGARCSMYSIKWLYWLLKSYKVQMS